MTSRLRRKRQTTARSTSSAKAIDAPRRRRGRAGPFVATLTLLWLTSANAWAAADDDAQLAGLSAVKAAAYSEQISGLSAVKTATYDPPATSRLRWQPVGARVVRSAGQSWAINEVMPTAAISPLPADPPASVSTRAAGDPFNDPFEDHRAVAADSRAASDPFKDPFGDHPPAKVPATATAAPEPLGTASATAESQRLPTIQESVKRKAAPADKCPSPGDFKSICAISADISENKGDMPPECGLGDLQFRPRCWGPKTYTWTASGLCHKPLYFEDVQLERYGHSYGPLLQPLISPAEFFLTFPVLPYKMGLTPPNECMYALGYYRPGDCAPYMFDAIPISVRASLFEAAAWTGAIAAVP